MPGITGTAGTAMAVPLFVGLSYKELLTSTENLALHRLLVRVVSVQSAFSIKHTP